MAYCCKFVWDTSRPTRSTSFFKYRPGVSDQCLPFFSVLNFIVSMPESHSYWPSLCRLHLESAFGDLGFLFKPFLSISSKLQLPVKAYSSSSCFIFSNTLTRITIASIKPCCQGIIYGRLYTLFSSSVTESWFLFESKFVSPHEFTYNFLENIMSSSAYARDPTVSLV